MTGPRAVIAIATILLGATLAGCSEEDPVPRVEPSSSASSGSPSGSPSASPSADPMTPEETVRAWVEAQNEALHSGDVGPMRTYHAPHCRGCMDFTSRITEVYQRGGYYRGGSWRIAAAKVAGKANGGVVVTAAIHFAAGTTLETRGETPHKYGEDKAIMEFHLVLHKSAWLLDYIGFVG